MIEISPELQEWINMAESIWRQYWILIVFVGIPVGLGLLRRLFKR